MEARRRPETHAGSTGPRFGFTVTKKLGGAVVRNRIRRRLKAAVAEVQAGNARDGYDYVIVARAAALERSYADIMSDVRRAFATIHKSPAKEALLPPKRPDRSAGTENGGKIP